jgi:hypothetical protein
MNSYVQGSLVTIQATFALADGVLTNPTAVTAEWRDPGGTVHSTTPTSPSTGVWQADIDTTPFDGGEVLYKFLGTGTCQAANVGSFKIIGLPF